MQSHSRSLIVAASICMIGCGSTRARPFELGGVTAAGADTASFDVRSYGAVADGQTDNTQAFSSCLDAIIEAGGGRMVIPDGVYNGRILVPGIGRPMGSWITIEIVGDSAPTPVFGTIGSFPLQGQGTIIRCADTEGPAVISVQRAERPLYGGFAAVNLVLRNLDVRTTDNPAIGGVDLRAALQCRLENVFINTGVYNVAASEPTHGTVGLVTPANNNAAWTLLRNVTVTGYFTGVVVHEHTDGEYVVVASNVNGLAFAHANHASRFGRVGAYRNTHHITVTGRHGFRINQLNTEQAGPNQTHDGNAWQSTQHDIYDPKSLGTGDVDYWVVIGNVGARDVFVKKGGAGIRTRRIGSTGSK